MSSPLPSDTTEIIPVRDRTVPCDGGGGVLGHPRVYLRIIEQSIMCPYCSRHYVLEPGAGEVLKKSGPKGSGF